MIIKRTARILRLIVLMLALSRWQPAIADGWLGGLVSSGDSGPVAVLIVNSHYRHLPPADPDIVGAADALAERMRARDTDVLRFDNPPRAAAQAMLDEISERTASAKAATLYYFGHGVSRREVAYWVPADFDPPRDEVSDQQFTLARLLTAGASRHGDNLAMIDAPSQAPDALERIPFVDGGIAHDRRTPREAARRLRLVIAYRDRNDAPSLASLIVAKPILAGMLGPWALANAHDWRVAAP